MASCDARVALMGSRLGVLAHMSRGEHGPQAEALASELVAPVASRFVVCAKRFVGGDHAPGRDLLERLASDARVLAAAVTRAGNFSGGRVRPRPVVEMVEGIWPAALGVGRALSSSSAAAAASFPLAHKAVAVAVCELASSCARACGAPDFERHAEGLIGMCGALFESSALPVALSPVGAMVTLFAKRRGGSGGGPRPERFVAIGWRVVRSVSDRDLAERVDPDLLKAVVKLLGQISMCCACLVQDARRARARVVLYVCRASRAGAPRGRRPLRRVVLFEPRREKQGRRGRGRRGALAPGARARRVRRNPRPRAGVLALVRRRVWRAARGRALRGRRRARILERSVPRESGVGLAGGAARREGNPRRRRAAAVAGRDQGGSRVPRARTRSRAPGRRGVRPSRRRRVPPDGPGSGESRGPRRVDAEGIARHVENGEAFSCTGVYYFFSLSFFFFFFPFPCCCLFFIFQLPPPPAQTTHATLFLVSFFLAPAITAPSDPPPWLAPKA